MKRSSPLGAGAFTRLPALASSLSSTSFSSSAHAVSSPTTRLHRTRTSSLACSRTGSRAVELSWSGRADSVWRAVGM